MVLWFHSYARLTVSCTTTFLLLLTLLGVKDWRYTALMAKHQSRREQRMPVWATPASKGDVIYGDILLFHQSGGRKADPSVAGKHSEKSQ